MRLRHALAGAIGSLGLLLTLPTSANAATGTFAYVYETGAGPYTTALVDPPSGQCVTIPSPGLSPAYSPRNLTSSYATVFTGFACTGAAYVLRPYEGQGSPLVGIRSVRFT
ncbi:hypothetical protein [Streptomyces sp. TS71-3]|uniref:hypothetical protein n=1 Tax=Streptomyces sp. TS71-3 TaxID=2733862 RepID=UPI001B00BEE9|nr:hypothetical protein [Streptomyces sp. TS71-3]GHJ38809.1 hypothetical protein Sm713_44180 [Streptomyces sp. TS71-3]